MANDSLFKKAYERRQKKARSKHGIHQRKEKHHPIGEEIEVKRLGLGLEGSWHSATVIGLGSSRCRVRYDSLALDDDDHSVELINGGGSFDIDDMNLLKHKSELMIRPVHSPMAVNKWSLHYGLCVDACLKDDAWWEGVVIDHEDGFEERLIFFPDSGNQKMINVEQLRVTRELKEGSGRWTIRGNWLFLELLEENGVELSSGNVCLRQIWNDLRAKEDFEKRVVDWTCREPLKWDPLLQEVIGEMGLTHKLIEVSNKGRKISDSQFSPNSIVPRNSAVLQVGDRTSTPSVDANGPINAGVLMQPQGAQVVPNDAGIYASSIDTKEKLEVGGNNVMGKEFMFDEPHVQSICSNEEFLAFIDFTPPDEIEHPTHRLIAADKSQEVDVQRKADEDFCSAADDSTCSAPMLMDPAPREEVDWQRAGIDIVPRAEYCPEALVNYYAGSHRATSKDTNHDSTITKARMHLLYMGWKIECRRGTKGSSKFRYTSPDGQTKYSLALVCKHLIEQKGEAWNQVVNKGHQNMGNIPDELLNSSVFHEAVSRFHEQNQWAVETPYNDSFPCSNSPEMEVSSPASTPDISVGEAAYCPQAVIEWNEMGSDREKRKLANGKVKDLTAKAKKHLLAVGWRIWYIAKKNKYELRYTSPSGKSYISLVTACKACVEDGSYLKKMRPTNGITTGEESKAPATGEKVSPAKKCIEADKILLPISSQTEKCYTEPPDLSQARGLKVGNVIAKGVKKHQELQNDSPSLISGRSQNQRSGHFQISQDETAIVHSKPKRASVEQGHQLEGSALQSNNRARRVLVLSQRNPRTVLSTLIHNNVVLPEDYVYYRGKHDGSRLAEGRITFEGIRCNCCQEVFGLTGFETHAGSTNHRPAANIFLLDGRSLLQCQKQLDPANGVKSTKPSSHEKPKRKRIQCDNQNENDHICSVCHYGGTLLLCEQCPSAFHLSCIGLMDLPEGQWFCPSCRCGVCLQRDLNGDFEQLEDRKMIYCHQCERKYHMGCKRSRGLFKQGSCTEGSWFCSEKCEQIFAGLHIILGQSIPVGVDKLSWTILKPLEDGNHHIDSSGTGSNNEIEHRRKLNLAVEVMHECFKPIKEPGAEKDIVEDVIYNRRSELNRLNFWGFYTVLLEREGEVISVAPVRIYGEKVAEVPLVGTRFQYRRQGMCRTLFDMLEKKLVELGVQRLVLPAAPQVLKTWTESFGFSEMTSCERLMFLEHTFLDFQDTTMCQKSLRSQSF